MIGPQTLGTALFIELEFGFALMLLWQSPGISLLRSEGIECYFDFYRTPQLNGFELLKEILDF